MTVQKTTQVSEMYKSFSMNVLLPLVMTGLLGVIGWISKLEERQYALQREAVTEQKLGSTETRIMSYIDIRMKDLDNKMNLMIRQLEMLNYSNSKKGE